MLRLQSLIPALVAAALGLVALAPARAADPRPLPEDTLEQQRAAAQRARDTTRGLIQDIGHRVTTTTQFHDGEGEKGAGVLEAGGQRYEVNKLVPGADPNEVERLKQLKDADIAELERAGEDYRRGLDQDSSDAAQTLRQLGRQPRADVLGMADDPDVRTAMERARQPEALREFADCRTRTTLRPGTAEEAYTLSERTCETLRVRPPSTREREVSIDHETVIAFDRMYALTTTPQQGEGEIVTDPNRPLLNVEANLTFTGAAAGVRWLEEPSPFNNWAFRFEVTPPATPPAQVCTLPPHSLPCQAGTPGCVCSPGQHIAYVTVEATLTYLEEQILSAPEDPLLATDGWCTARWTCTDSAPRTIAGVTIDDSFSGYLSELYPYNNATNQPPSSTSPVCWRAEATYDCPFNAGTLCWQQPDGSQQCETNPAGPNEDRDTCQPLRVDPQCQFARSMCNEDANGHGDFCHVLTQVFECRDPIPVPSIVAEEENTCSGIARCAGDNCIDLTERRPVEDLGNVMANLTLMQHALSDNIRRSEYLERTRAAGATVREKGDAKSSSIAPERDDYVLFPGQPLECRKALAGSLDCCRELDSNGKADYFETYADHMTQGNAKIFESALEAKGAEDQGVWSKLQSSDAMTYRDMTSGPLVSFLEAIRGEYPGQQGFRGLASAKAYQEPGPAPEKGSTNRVQEVMDIYRAQKQEEQRNGWYCTAQELDLAAQREAGACSYVGAYCKSSVLGACVDKRDTYMCFNSPVSRVVQEYVHRDEEQPFGTAKRPRAPMLSKEVFEREDLSDLPMAEIKGFLSASGAVPNAQTLRQYTDMERQTGKTSRMEQPERANLAEQSASALAQIDTRKTFASVEADVRQRVAPPPDATTPGDVFLGPAITFATAGRPAIVYVQRRGKYGPVSVSYRTADRSARAGVDYEASEGVVHWDDGEEGVKLVRIPTLPRTTFGSGDSADGRVFEVHLSQPSRGARIHPVGSGEVIIKPERVANMDPVNNPPHGLRVVKRLVREKPYRNTTTGDIRSNELLWSIDITNTTGKRIVELYVTDSPPMDPNEDPYPNDNAIANLYSSYFPSGTGGDDFVARACWDPTFGSHGDFQTPWGTVGGWCHTRYPIEIGQTVKIGSITYLQLDGRPQAASLTNRCTVRATLDDGSVIDVHDGICRATARSSNTDTSTLRCGQATDDENGGYSDHRIYGFDATFGGPFGGTSGSVETRAAQSVLALAITPDGAQLGRSGTLHTGPGSTPPTAPHGYAKLSPCAGDLALPLRGHPGLDNREACASVRYAADGSIAEVNAPIHYRIGGADDPNVCVLDAGARYYLNLMGDDPRDGIAVWDFNQFCAGQPESWRGCSMTVTVTASGAAQTTAAAKGARASTALPSATDQSDASATKAGVLEPVNAPPRPAPEATPAPAQAPEPETARSRSIGILTPRSRYPEAAEQAPAPGSPTQPAPAIQHLPTGIFADVSTEPPTTHDPPHAWRPADIQGRFGTGKEKGAFLANAFLERGEFGLLKLQPDPESRLHTVRWQSNITQAMARVHGAYLRISEHPGDFRLPGATDGDAACVSDPTGSLQAEGVLYYRWGGAPNPHACVLNPTRSYWVNLVYDAPFDGLDPHARVCQQDKSRRCGVRLIVQ